MQAAVVGSMVRGADGSPTAARGADTSVGQAVVLTVMAMVAVAGLIRKFVSTQSTTVVESPHRK